MSNENQNFKKNINKSTKNNIDINENINNSFEDTDDNLQFNDTYKENLKTEENRTYSDEKSRRKKVDKPLKIFGGICIAISIVTVFFLNKSTVDTSESAKNALKNGISTSVSAGTILLSKDKDSQAKDYAITHNSNEKESKIWVWDYAGEDGDYVQVLVDGAPLGEAFMIKNKPKELIVPAVGMVQVKGIKDGGGGITYAVRYDINGTSYFNGTPEGELNTYTLTKE